MFTSYSNAELLLPPPYAETAPHGHVLVDSNPKNERSDHEAVATGLVSSLRMEDEQNDSCRDAALEGTPRSGRDSSEQRTQSALSSSSTEITASRFPPAQSSSPNWPTRPLRSSPSVDGLGIIRGVASRTHSPEAAVDQLRLRSLELSKTLPAGTERYRRKRLRRRVAGSRRSLESQFNAVSSASTFSFVPEANESSAPRRRFSEGQIQREEDAEKPDRLSGIFQFGKNAQRHVQFRVPLTDEEARCSGRRVSASATPAPPPPSKTLNKSSSPFRVPDFGRANRLPPITLGKNAINLPNPLKSP